MPGPCNEVIYADLHSAVLNVSLLNLTVGEFAALFSAISAVLIALYLLDRTRRRLVVATLRFWKPAENISSKRQKRRIQQPWSLVLQLLGIALLLLATAQLQLGTRNHIPRDHVLILDTSAWMGARSGRGTLMDHARLAALAWLRTVPSGDRVMLLRADVVATPATPLENNHAAVENAIRDSKPGAAALNLDSALAFAARIQKLHNRRAGEIAVVTAERVADADSAAAFVPSNVRLLQIKAPADDCGVRRMGLRPSPSDPAGWQVLVTAKNYGSVACSRELVVQFGGAPVGTRALTLRPGASVETTFSFHTRAAGWLEARLAGEDAFPEDDRALLEVPAHPPLRVTVFTDDPSALRPVLAANPDLIATFQPPSSYSAGAPADVVVFDRFAPSLRPRAPSIWIEPPPGRSPVPVRQSEDAVRLMRWNNDHELGAGLHTRDVQIDRAEIFGAGPDDIVVAEAEHGPVIVARDESTGDPRTAVIGFNPVRTAMKYELATPLLFANLLRWMHPGVFRPREINAEPVGAITVRLDRNSDPKSVRVAADDRRPIPYTIQNGELRFFSASPGNVRVYEGGRELVFSLSLPEIGDAVWDPPAHIRRGIPRGLPPESPVTETWPWLALAAAAVLGAEWMLFARGRREAQPIRRPKSAAERVLRRRAS
jgi:hypothetical protein